MLPERRTVKRGLTVAVALVVIGSVLAAAPVSVAAQEQPTAAVEPNDAPVGGTPVLTGTVNGTLDPAGADYDWYLIRAEEGETIEATANFAVSDSQAEFSMRILAPNGSSITNSYETGSQVGVAAVAPESGIYYIGVQSGTYIASVDPSSTISYTLTVSPTMDTPPASYTGMPDLADQPQPENEPNNARLGAARVQGAPINGSIDQSGDDDWFAIEATAGERIEALGEYENVNTDTRVRMVLVAPNGTALAYNAEYNSSRVQVAAIARQSGTYYVHIETRNVRDELPYTLTAFSVGGASAEAQTTTQTPAQTSTTAGTETSTQSGTASLPPGYAASGITDPKRAITNHFSSLFAHESFTLTRKFPFLGPNATFTLVAQISMADKREYTNSTVTTAGRRTLHREYYVTEDAYYVAKLSNDTPTYRVADVSFMTSVRETTDAPLSDWDVLSKVIRYANFGDAEQVTRNGTTLWRYESTELLRPSKFVPLSGLKLNETNEYVVNGTVNAFNATVLVDADGIVHSTSYSITYTTAGGKQMTVTGTVEVNRIDATTVEKPDWLDEAKASTSGQITATGQATTTPPQTATATATPTQTPTPTMMPTETTTSAGTASGGNASNGTTSGGNASGGSSMFGPGFGPVVAVVALLAAALLAARRR